MSRISCSVRLRKATIGPSAVIAAAVGQHSQTRKSTGVSAICFQLRSNAPKRNDIAPLSFEVITTVLLPERNKKDFEDVPETARTAVRFVWLSTVDDAVEAALEPLAPAAQRPDRPSPHAASS